MLYYPPTRLLTAMLFSLQLRDITHTNHTKLKVPLTQPDSWTDPLLDCGNVKHSFGESQRRRKNNDPEHYSEGYMCTSVSQSNLFCFFCRRPVFNSWDRGIIRTLNNNVCLALQEHNKCLACAKNMNT